MQLIRKLKYNIKNFMKTSVFPINTRRRVVAQFFLAIIKHPIRSIKHLHPRKITAAYYTTKDGGIKQVVRNLFIKIAYNQAYDFEPPLIRIFRIFYKKISLPQSDAPLVSIIVPAYNNFSFTYASLISIKSNTTLPYEVIVADDSSTDKTKHISKIINNVVHIRSDKNLKFVLNCNNAARHAKGKYIFFLNNDTQIHPECIESLVSLIEQDDTIGMVGSKLIYPNGMLQDAGGIVFSNGTPINSGRGEEPNQPEYNYVRDVDYITGAALLIRKSIWDALGGFDERFAPAYYEDTDLAFAVRELGYRTVIQPKSIVIHFEGITHGTDLTKGMKHYQTVNASAFFDKWKHVLSKDHLNFEKDYKWAQFHNRTKKVAIFVDHEIPDFDRTAGSRNIFAYIEIFRELGYHVIFVADTFYASQPYTDILQQMGILVLYGPRYNHKVFSDWLHENGRYIDFAYLHRPIPSYKHIKNIKRTTNAKISYHVADIHHVRLMAQYEIEKDNTLRREALEMEAIEHYLCTLADVVLTVSEKEKPILQEIAPGKPVFVAPIFYYDTFPAIKPFSNRHNVLFVGNFRHTPNVSGILWFVDYVMPLLPDINLIIAGSSPPDSIKALASSNITVTGYISDEALEELYLTSRICIVPLQYGAGVKGKTVEAIYYQIPIVSTSSGAEGLPLEDLIPTLDMPEHFACGIIKFLNSDEECERAALEYKKWIQKWFSKERVVQITQEILSTPV